ncbi:MAG: Rrf2 family transcriptional regulator [Deltaproteobacteria bacterium]|nr:Rrf2 family transcriptional regulator [Deltaproteobacteria bacterium]
MRVSRRCEYALRALLELGLQKPGGRPLTVGQIARAQRVPEGVLANLLVLLKRAKLVTSVQGARGGFYLAKKPAEITLGEVLRLIDGPVAVAPIKCLAGERPKECAESECSYYDVWGEVRDAISRIVDATTLENVIDRSRSQREGRPIQIMYYI